MMIGLAKVDRGLYIFKQKGAGNPRLLHNLTESSPNKSFRSHSSNAFIDDITNSIPLSKHFDYWHYRLGHIPFDRIKLIQRSCKDVVVHSKGICVVCQRARQKRQRFSLHVSSFVCSFELVHMDVWGPYFESTLSGFR